MKKFKQFSRTLAVNATILSLLQTSLVFTVHAEDDGESKDDDIVQTARIVQGVMGKGFEIYSQSLGMKRQMVQQMIMAQKNQQLMQTLSPNCRKPDNTSCYTVAGKFFPECPLPASMSNMPQNICQAASPNPADIAQMITYESIANGWINYYDQMMNEASNMSVPFGLKCLQDKQKALDSQLTEMVNNLTRMQDQLNKEKEIFRANNKKLLDEMGNLNDELTGGDGSGKKDLKLKTQDFSKHFSQSCQSVIGDEALAQGPSTGLIGIMQTLSPANKRAADYNQNRALIESEVRNDITKIQNAIKNGGLDDFINGKNTESSKYQSLVVATKKKAAEFQLSKTRIADELKKLNYEIPPMDKNFNVDFEEFLAGSKTFFKKQYINECVTGADKSGVAISTDQILNSLQQKSTDNGGTARNKYKAALSNILNSDAFIEDKLSQIKALEATYKDITITYQNSSAQRVTETPYDLYMKTIARCEERFKQDDQFSANGSSGVSQKKKVDRGQALLRELKGLHDNYSSELGSRILDQVLNCNGESKKAGADCGGKDTFNHSSESFCMNQATQCANEVNGCYAEATKHIETRKAKMESLAKTFNKNAEVMVALSNRLYDQQKVAVMNMVKLVQARFPGTNFEIPEDMFISMPELKKDAFGVALANDGKLSFMDELPKKIDLLKKVFREQQKKTNDEIDNYIGKQQEAMGREKGRWSQLASECKGMINTSSSQIAADNNRRAKEQADIDAKVGSFCRKFSALKSNPMPGCEDSKDLAEDADKIAARLTDSALTYTAQYKSTCNMYNNEDGGIPDYCRGDEDDLKDLSSLQKSICRKTSAPNSKAASSSSPSRRPRVNVNKYCKDSDGKINGDDAFIKAIAKNLSKDDQKKLKSVTNLDELNNKIEDLSDDAADFFAEIKNYKKDDKSLCTSLTEINDKSIIGTSQEKINEELKNITTAEAELDSAKAAQSKAAQSKAAKPEEKTAAETAVNNAQTKLNNLSANKPDLEMKKQKFALAETFQLLSGEPSSEDEKKELAFRKIGQQSDESCDAQASNVNMPKNFFNLSPNQLDKAILGISK